MLSLVLTSMTLPTGPNEPVSYVAGHVGVQATGSGAVEFLSVDDRGRKTVVGIGGEGLGFKSANKTADGLVLVGDSYTCTIRVPGDGDFVSVAVQGSAAPDSLASALFQIGLKPNGKDAKPTDWYAPPSTNPSAVTSERFGTPVVLATAGGYGAALMPDMDDLAVNRPMAPVLGVDASGRMSPSAILYYGFASYKRNANGTAELIQRKIVNPAKFSWKFDVAIAKDSDIVGVAEQHLWEKYGVARSKRMLPQTVPFRYYTKPTLDMERGGGEEEGGGGDEPEEEGLWWETESGKEKLMAPKSGDNLVRLTSDENVVRFAWALRWWGGRLKQYSWESNADAVINLLLRARPDEGRSIVAFNTETARWVDGPFDPSAVAQTARWKLKYLTDFANYKERDEVLAQVSDAEEKLVKRPLTGLGALFLYEFANSDIVKDRDAKRRAGDAVKKALASSKEGATTELRDTRTPNPDIVAVALLSARTGDKRAARAMLERMFLSQTVRQPTNVVGAVTFGDFASEHFAAETQSAYTADLLETAVLTDDQRLAERAVVALRGPLGLFFHATHSISQMRLPDKIPFFRSTPWFGEGASCDFGDWRGVSDGIGQSLASIGEAMDAYGSIYTDEAGWTIGIDGVTAGSDGVVRNAFATNPFTFEGTFPYLWKNAKTGKEKTGDLPADLLAIRTITLDAQSGEPTVMALPGFTVSDASKLSGSFTFGDGSSAAAQLLPTGFGAKVDAKLLQSGGVTFTGRYGDATMSAGPVYFSIGPPAPDVSWPLGWRRTGLLSDTARPSLTDGEETLISTADDGHGGSDLSLTGRIESQVFSLDKNGLKFVMLGKPDDNINVELIDANLSVPIKSAHKTIDGPEPVTWELFTQVGALFYVRITDNSKTGAIAIKSLKSADVSPGGQKRMP